MLLVRKNKKIAILALTPPLNLSQALTLALTLTLILTQTQNLTQTLMIYNMKKSSLNEEKSL